MERSRTTLPPAQSASPDRALRVPRPREAPQCRSNPAKSCRVSRSDARQFSERASRPQRSLSLANAARMGGQAQLFCARQPSSFPSFEPAGHGADVFVAHFLQTLSGQRRTAASAAVANDRCVHIGNFFFDIELKSAATQVNRAGNMLFVPFVFLADIDNHRLAAL